MPNTPANPAKPRKPSKARAASPRPAASPAAPAPLTMADEAASKTLVARGGGFREAPNRARMIEEAAYYLAERRGFAPGHEQQDWLEAEREIDAALESSLDATVSGPPN